jgi:hypothetical protein
MLALQATMGNSAMGRLLAPPRRALARFGEPEHKGIGDKALDARWRLPGSRLFRELELTFGDWVALGDWFDDIGEIKALLRGGAGADTVGQVYYALLVRIRPTNEHESKAAEREYQGVLFTAADKAAVDARYALLKTRNIKHFPNPLAGDTTLSTKDKVQRRRDGKPFGALAQYHADHLEAIGLAMSAAQLGEERLVGEALAIDGLACHYLTDAFSASHTRTPRSSIETYWDKKVPAFDDKLVAWLADEVTFVIDTQPSGAQEWIGSKLDAPFGVVRDTARKTIRAVVPPLSFGDVIGLVVHDWEGAHGADGHGPLVEVAGHRFRTVGDDRLLPALAALTGVDTDVALNRVLADPRRGDTERTLAGATLAVRASVTDVQRAYDLAQKGWRRSAIIAELLGRPGLFAAERLVPTAVPEAQLPADDRLPKWDYDTVDQLLNDPKIRAALPESAAKVAAPFADTVNDLQASKAVKAQLRRVVIDPLTSKSIPTIAAWLKAIIAYSPQRLDVRLRASDGGLKEDVNRVRQSVR